MSTTIKRVALVAVAALGLGVLSVAPSQAAHQADTLTLTATKSAISAGETATATVNSAFIAAAANDSITVNALVTSKPTSGDGTLKFAVADSLTGTITTGNLTSSISTGAPNANTPVNSNYTLNFVSPTVAGTYVVQVYAVAGTGGGAGTIRSSVLSWTVTVTDVDRKSDATSTSFIAQGAAVPAIADSASVTLSKTTGSQAATILVTQKNATSTANESMTATISGPGLLGTGSSTSAASTGRAVTVKNGDYVTVWSDGTSGVATITIVGNTSGLTLGTESVTFFDTKPASVTVTVKKAYILAGTTEVSKVLAVVVKDSAGNPVTNATVTAAVTDTTTTVGGAATCTAYNTTDKVYYCGIKGLSATKFGKVNYTVTASDGAAVATKATAVADVTFSAGVAKSVTITGPASAAPGDKITLTLTAKDANGYPVADQSYEGAEGAGIFWNTKSTLVPDYSASTFKPFNSGETFTTVSGVATLDVYVPVTGVSASATWTLAGDGITTTGAIDKSIGATTIAYKVAISNPGVDAATDAANEAAQAASDATDAALAAADAADAATTAVAALSAQVNKLVAALKAQITTLTNLVLKIQKKVRA